MLSEEATELKKKLGIIEDGDCNKYINGKATNFIQNLDDDCLADHREKVLIALRNLLDRDELDESDITEWPHFSELFDDEKYLGTAVNEYVEWAESIDKEGKADYSAFTMGNIAASLIAACEEHKPDNSLFIDYSEDLIESNPEKARAIIVIRKIANGD